MTDNIKDVKKAFESAEDIAPDETLEIPEDTSEPPRTSPDAPPPAPPVDDPHGPFIEGAKFPLNDTGNGQRFAHYFGDDVFPVPRVCWFVWDGKRWSRDPDGLAVRGKAQLVQKQIIHEIPHVMLEDWQLREIDEEAHILDQQSVLAAIDPDKRSAKQQVELEDLSQRLLWIKKLKDLRSDMKGQHRSFAKTSGNKARIDAILVESTVQLARNVDDLDADPMTVNCETGLLRFSVGGGDGAGFSKTADMVCEPHVRAAEVSGKDALQYITKMMPVEYDRAATCPTFDAFLERIQPSRDMRGFLQRWLGLSMTGLTGEQKFAFFYGAGANGKSVLVDLMAKIFGDYSATAKIESLTGRNRRGGGDATPDLIPLVGARMVRASEPEEGERLQEGVIKELTGGEPILVRQLHSDFIEVKPIFKLTISGNHKPDIRGTDDGIWRRVLLVPFDVQIPVGERDADLGNKLMAERSGILNWLVDGFVAYLEGGLQEPAAVLEATKDYRADSDPIGAYLKECCIVSGDPADFTTSRDLMDGFNLWMDMKGEGMWGPRTVSLKLKALADQYRDPGTGKKFTAGKQRVTGYRGIRFQDMFQRDFDEAPRNTGGHPVVHSARSRTVTPDGSGFE